MQNVSAGKWFNNRGHIAKGISIAYANQILAGNFSKLSCVFQYLCAKHRAKLTPELNESFPWYATVFSCNFNFNFNFNFIS